MNDEKIEWVNSEIDHTLTGWYVVSYMATSKECEHTYFNRKFFDRKMDAKRFISECKKEIRNYEQQLKKEYLRYLKY